MARLSYCFSLNQDWQEKCRQEIIKVFGNRINVEWDNISKLQNLDLCIKETLRLYPIAPLLARTVNSALTLVDLCDSKKFIILQNYCFNYHIFTVFTEKIALCYPRA